MRSRVLNLISVAFGFFAISSIANAQIVISQVYGGGGNSGAPFNSDFIELHNNGSTTINLTGWSVQYASSTGTTWQATNLSGSIASGQYLLIRQGGGATGAALPTPDVTGTIAMSGSNGKVALVSTTTLLTSSCPASTAYVDFVGYGSANCFEGTGATPALTNTTAAIRNSNGCTDTNNNNTDFIAGAPNPRNAASAANFCTPPVPALSINDVTVTEGNSGTVNAVFTISLASNATSDLTFNVSTSDGTASISDNDYVAASQSVTITAGNNSANFTVIVNGDTVSEVNETFNVNVSSYANIADGTGIGTITNDDAVLPTLSINDITQAEGNTGSSNFSFTVSLSEPAGAGGVSFDYATSDGSATTANNDYTATSATAATIPAGATFTVLNVPVNGDSNVEPNESFNLTISNASGAIITDAVGVGVINNDDFTPIHAIQGNARRSPITVGTIVTTQGIVTARVSNGFYIQTPDAEADADALTSQGLFVFTSAAPPASAAVGARVEVIGTLTEFSSTSLLPITELTTVTVTQLSTGNPLPTPAILTNSIVNANSTLDTLERYEGMRVTASYFKVVAANGATIVESTASISASSPNGDGIFYVTVPDVARPLREPGIPLEDGFTPSKPNVPVFDANPERLRVRSQSQTGASVMRVDVGDEIVMTGVLDFFDWYTILPDPVPAPAITRNSVSNAVSNKAADEFTVGAFNLLRFFDSVDDPNGDPVLTATALTNRLRKTGNAICAYTKNPDILGVVEVENLSVLQQLATAINTGDTNVMFPSACSENPNYEAILLEGNDVGGIDVGFLIKKTNVRPSVSRVQIVGSPVQIGKNTLFTNADNSTELLNDRPSLKIKAIINDDDGGSVPVTVYVNHLRSLNGITTHTATPVNGWPTTSARVRAKRVAQAMELAADIQSEQTANPTARIVMVGDFNAFEFNDGYADVMGIVTGREAANDQVENYADSPITTPLNVIPDDAGPARNYSFSFEGNAQSLDHVVVNQALISQADAYRAEHARINADFGEDLFGNYTLPQRVSDHDPVVLFVKAQELRPNVDLLVRVFRSPQPLQRSAKFSVYVANTSNTNAATADVIFVVNAEPGDFELKSPGWNCATPVYDTGTASSSFLCQLPGGLAAGQNAAAIFSASAERVSATGGDIVLGAGIGSPGTHDSDTSNNFSTATFVIPAR